MGSSVLTIIGLMSLLVGQPLSIASPDQPSFRRLFSEGCRLHSEGEFRQSLAIFALALADGRRDPRHSYAAKSLLHMGVLNWDLGDLEGSEGCIEEAETLFRQSGDLRSQEFCAKCLDLVRLYELGRKDRQDRLYYRSIDGLTQALALGREIGILDLQPKCSRQLALTYLELGEMRLFFEGSQAGLDVAAKVNDRIEQARCLNNIGIYHQLRADYSQAVSCLERALPIVQSVGDAETEAECVNNLGLVYRELGNLDRALYYLKRALDLDRTRSDPRAISLDLANIGSVLLRRGIDQESRQDLLQALEIFQKCLLTTEAGNPDPQISLISLNNIGIIFNELKDYPGARLRFIQALKILGWPEHDLQRSHVFANIAASYWNESKIEDALSYYRMSCQMGQKDAADSVLLESLLGLGRCYEKKGDGDLALSYYGRAIEALAEVKARLSEPLMIGFARNKLSAYERAINILAEGYALSGSTAVAERIFDLVERARAGSFLESLREAKTDPLGMEIQQLRDRHRLISRNIKELSSRFNSSTLSKAETLAIENELDQEEEESVRLSSELRDSGRFPVVALAQTIRSLSDIQPLLLDEGAVLLEYFLGEQRSYLIRVSPSSIRLYPLPAKKDLEGSVRAYIKSLSDTSIDPEVGFGASERIARCLMPPEDLTLQNAKALIIVPDGILHYLPFEALRIRSEAGARYLVENQAVSYCPSASALTVLRNRSRPIIRAKEILAVGDPNHEGTPSGTGRMRLPRLPFSRNEIRAIARLYPASSVDVLTGERADESSIKSWPLKDYRIIHFACHGFLDELSPLRSALALSTKEGSEDDGFLQMREIYGLSLNAELVVLSACSMGMGRLERSEGVLAMARPFFFAGARAVLASLWPISDASAVPFMREFYRMLSEGRSAAMALREAKLRMLRSRRSHPCYWASFMLQGDPLAGSLAY